jgi:hypothetical protein
MNLPTGFHLLIKSNILNLFSPSKSKPFFFHPACIWMFEDDCNISSNPDSFFSHNEKPWGRYIHHKAIKIQPIVNKVQGIIVLENSVWYMVMSTFELH